METEGTPLQSRVMNVESDTSDLEITDTREGGTVGADSSCCTSKNMKGLLIVYLMWLFPLTFLLPHGGHWLYLAHVSGDASLRIHAFFYWTTFVLFWCFRQPMLPWYIQCPLGPDGQNVTMSTRCLYTVQTTPYAFFYTMHIILLSFLIFHWLVEPFVLHRLIRQANLTVAKPNPLNGHFWLFPVVVVMSAILCVGYVLATWWST